MKGRNCLLLSLTLVLSSMTGLLRAGSDDVLSSMIDLSGDWDLLTQIITPSRRPTKMPSEQQCRYPAAGMITWIVFVGIGSGRMPTSMLTVS